MGGVRHPNKLNKISVEGGAVVPLGDIATLAASWGEDGNIIVGDYGGRPRHGADSIQRRRGHAGDGTGEWRGGPCVPANPARWQSRVVHGIQRMAPTSITPVSRSSLWRIAAGKPWCGEALLAHYVATSNGAGHLVYSHKGTLFAIPFDLNRLETRGTAVPVLDGVAYETLPAPLTLTSPAPAHWSTARPVAARGDRVTTIQWLDAAGKKEPLLAKPGTYGALRLSPDGKRLAVSVGEGSSRDIWVYDPQRDAMTRLTFGGGIYADPIWSPDGRYVVFGSVTGTGMFWTRADGAGQPQPFTQSKNDQTAASFSPDGKRLAYNDSIASPAHDWQIWTVPVEDSGGQLRAGKPEQFLKTQFNDGNPVFSPDGQWLAYNRTSRGRTKCTCGHFRRRRPGKAASGRSRTAAEIHVWSRKGRELLYQSGDQIMAVKYTVKGDFIRAGEASGLGGEARRRDGGRGRSGSIWRRTASAWLWRCRWLHRKRPSPSTK